MTIKEMLEFKFKEATGQPLRWRSVPWAAFVTMGFFISVLAVFAAVMRWHDSTPREPTPTVTVEYANADAARRGYLLSIDTTVFNDTAMPTEKIGREFSKAALPWTRSSYTDVVGQHISFRWESATSEPTQTIVKRAAMHFIVITDSINKTHIYREL